MTSRVRAHDTAAVRNEGEPAPIFWSTALLLGQPALLEDIVVGLADFANADVGLVVDDDTPGHHALIHAGGAISVSALSSHLWLRLPLQLLLQGLDLGLERTISLLLFFEICNEGRQFRVISVQESFRSVAKPALRSRRGHEIQNSTEGAVCTENTILECGEASTQIMTRS